jgi:hypothetical protein
VAEETGEEETIRCGWSGGAGVGGEDKIGLGLAVRRAAYIAAVGWQAGPAGWALLGWAVFGDITAIFPVGYISRVLIVSGYFSCRVRVQHYVSILKHNTARPSCRVDTDTMQSCSCSCRVVFFSVVPPVVSDPFGHL